MKKKLITLRCKKVLDIYTRGDHDRASDIDLAVAGG